MSIFSPRKRLLNRTPKAPKMSSRRQFHRALRRHPDWPKVMEIAAARAKAHKEELAALAKLQKQQARAARAASGNKWLRNPWLHRLAMPKVTSVKDLWPRDSNLRRRMRRNRVLVVTLLGVGGLVAIMVGFAEAGGVWGIQLNQTPQPPSPRFGAASTFDEANSQVLIFGGFGTSVGDGLGFGKSIQSLVDKDLNKADTYIYQASTSTWGSRSPVNHPSPRGFAAAAYDGARRNVVLFGGALYRNNASASGETWIWDGANWTLQNPPEPRPEPRQNHVMVYDAHRKVVVMFGGLGRDGKPLDDTWTWNGSAWKIMPSEGAPSPRHSAAIAYDLCNAEAVMFGGVGDPVNNFATQPGETWTWNGAKWTHRTPVAPAISPPRRTGASMSFSPSSGRALLYGGFAAADTGHATAAVDTDVWRWDGAGGTWEKMNSEATTAAYVPCGLLIACLFGAPFGGQPPARGYASFVNMGGWVNLYGGTPAADPPTTLPILSGVSPQIAFDDHYQFGEDFVFGTDDPKPLVGDTPLTRRCVNPVPVPADGAVSPGESNAQTPQVQIREGLREIGRLPVLIGTDWPLDNRNTHNGNAPNPNHTPAPECPNRVNRFAPAGSAGRINAETGGQTHLVADPKRNRIYQFFICDPDRGLRQQSQLIPPVHRLLVGVYEATTLKPLRSVLLPVRVEMLGLQNFLDDLLLHDQERGRFLVRSNYYDASAVVDQILVLQQDLLDKGINPIIKQIPLSGSIAKMSFFNHPTSGRAKLLINRGTMLSQIDLESNSSDWGVAVTGCTSMGGTDPNSAITAMRPMRSGNRLYNGCIAGTNGTNRHGVVRISLVQQKDGSETPGLVEAFAGPYGVIRNWGDPEAERMLLLSQTFGGVTMWAFDGKFSRYVGQAGLNTLPTGANSQYGFDQETGRFYHHSADDNAWSAGEKYKQQGGLRVLEARLTPLAQATNFPQFSAIPAAPVASLASMPGAPRRVLIRRGGGTMKKYPVGESVKMENEMFYTVLADEIPIPERAELSDLDALTVAVPEAQGKTEINFDAEGSGYGIRLRSIGGVWSAVRPFQQISSSGNTGELVESLVLGSPRPLIPSCVFPDRELMAGFVPQARLSDLEALAVSSGLEVDSNSKADLTGPVSRCNPSAGPSNFPPSAKPVLDVLWPMWQLVQFETNQAAGPQLAWDRHFKAVECVGDALSTYRANVGNVYGSSKCVKKQGSVEATAQGSATGAGPASEAASAVGFSVAEGYSNVKVAREPVRGVVVTSTAVAKGIQLSDLTIGLVKTEAVAWSNGRPGEKRTSFTRTICQMTSPRFEHEKECLTEQEQKDFVKQWNDRWGINSKMYLPTPDPEYFQGSPGGYIVGVIKPTGDSIEDQLFAKDFQREVPGLVIEFVKDSQAQGPARQSLMLAATRAVAGFGVQCNAEHIYSPEKKDCVPFVLDDLDVSGEEAVDEEESFEPGEEAIPATEGYWQPVAAAQPALSIGSRLGRFIGNLPVINRLPIRAMGEALLASSVWLLLGAPLVFAYRRLSIW